MGTEEEEEKKQSSFDPVNRDFERVKQEGDNSFKTIKLQPVSRKNIVTRFINFCFRPHERKVDKIDKEINKTLIRLEHYNFSEEERRNLEWYVQDLESKKNIQILLNQRSYVKVKLIPSIKASMPIKIVGAICKKIGSIADIIFTNKYNESIDEDFVDTDESVEDQAEVDVTDVDQKGVEEMINNIPTEQQENKEEQNLTPDDSSKESNETELANMVNSIINNNSTDEANSNLDNDNNDYNQEPDFDVVDQSDIENDDYDVDETPKVEDVEDENIDKLARIIKKFEEESQRQKELQEAFEEAKLKENEAQRKAAEAAAELQRKCEEMERRYDSLRQQNDKLAAEIKQSDINRQEYISKETSAQRSIQAMDKYLNDDMGMNMNINTFTGSEPINIAGTYDTQEYVGRRR